MINEDVFLLIVPVSSNQNSLRSYSLEQNKTKFPPLLVAVVVV